MDRPTDRKALRQQALAALDEARQELSSHVTHVRTEFAPRVLVAHGLAKYKMWIAGASLVAGFATVRLLFPRRARIDNITKPATNRSVTGLLMTGIWSLAGPPLIELAKERLLGVVMNRFGSTKTHPQD